MSSDQRAQVAALFDRTAGTYDRVGLDYFQPIAEWLVAELDPRPGERAVDIGCGRGAALFPLARAIGETGRTVGIDLAPRMVEATAAEAAAEGLPAEVRVGDAQEPDLEPESFDIVAASLVIFFLPDPAAALRSWRALLVDGGRVGITTFGPYSEEWKVVDEVFKPYQPKPPPGAIPPEKSPFASDAGVERLVGDAGFTGLRTATMTIEARFDDAEHWYHWTRSQGQLRVWESIPEEDKDRVRKAAFERAERCRDAHGRIGFDQQVRLTLARR